MTNGAARPPTRHHFFKPLLPGFLHEFSIPIAFFTKYLGGDPDREDHCKAGVLRSCSGKPFPVNIKGRRLEAGWPEFATEHDLHVGYFVVFGHEGALVFDVRVYDLSACERLYPRSVDPGEEAGGQSQPIGVGGDSDAESMKTGDFVVSGRAMKKREGIIQPKSVVVSFPSHPKRPSFSHILTFTNVEKSILYLPIQFAKENGLSKRSCEMILRDEEGRKWPVQLRYTLRRDLQQKPRVFISGGWRKLALANGLKIGDYLRFELVKNGTKPNANIYVVARWTKQSSSAMNPKSESKSKVDPSQLDMGQCSDAKSLKNITERSKNIIAPKHPFFVGVVQTRRRHLSVYVPAKFSRHFNLNGKHDQLIVKDGKGGSWLVRLYYKRNGETYMGGGWWSLIDANGLKNGDYFTVILLKQGAELVASFHVGRPIAEGRAEAPPRHFISLVKPYNLAVNQFTIPVKFTRAHDLLKKTREMTLHNDEGRSWLLSLNHVDRTGQVYLKNGWLKFALDNHIKVGDSVRFELVKNGMNPIMNFSVVGSGGPA